MTSSGFSMTVRTLVRTLTYRTVYDNTLGNFFSATIFEAHIELVQSRLLLCCVTVYTEATKVSWDKIRLASFWSSASILCCVWSRPPLKFCMYESEMASNKDWQFKKCVPPCPRYITGKDKHLFIDCLGVEWSGVEHARVALVGAACVQCELRPLRMLHSCRHHNVWCCGDRRWSWQSSSKRLRPSLASSAASTREMDA